MVPIGNARGVKSGLGVGIGSPLIDSAGIELVQVHGEVRDDGKSDIHVGWDRG